MRQLCLGNYFRAIITKDDEGQPVAWQTWCALETKEALGYAEEQAYEEAAQRSTDQ